LNNRIIEINLFGVKNEQLNYVINVSLLFSALMIWDTIFISCRSFKSIKFKDVEVTLEEREDIKYTDSVQTRQIKDLYNVLNTGTEMKRFIDLYVKRSDLYPDKSYEDIIKEYAKRRKIKAYTFTADQAGIKQMGTELKIDMSKVSAILYSIDLTGFCIAAELPNMNFSKLATKYKQNDIIIVLESETLIDKENFVLEDIINYFELKIDLEIEKDSTQTGDIVV
jgi:hypothetical protein